MTTKVQTIMITIAIMITPAIVVVVVVVAAAAIAAAAVIGVVLVVVGGYWATKLNTQTQLR